MKFKMHSFKPMKEKEGKFVWMKQIVLALIGLSAGTIVSGGLFSFIVSLGVVSDFADRTHTGKSVLLYEDSVTLGGTIGNIILLYGLPIPGGSFSLTVLGLLAGIFVGCEIMALAEVLNVFPIFIRRAKMVKYVPYIILAVAIGKGIGELIFAIQGW